jgi:hypothetical protein
VYALVFVANQQLRKHDAPLRVHGAVGDPVLVAQGGRAVNDEAAGAGLPGGSGGHLDSIVACVYGWQSDCKRVV